MMKSFKKSLAAQRSGGFTLIELLVVIAIIGILASIILASLGSARSKGGDAALKGTMSSMRSAAEIFAADFGSNSYTGFCTSATTTPMLAQLVSASGAASYQTSGVGALTKVTCHDGATGFAVQSPLKTDASMYWCVDSGGKAGTTTTNLPSGNTNCP